MRGPLKCHERGGRIRVGHGTKRARIGRACFRQARYFPNWVASELSPKAVACSVEGEE